jgi:hypothetical protein
VIQSIKGWLIAGILATVTYTGIVFYFAKGYGESKAAGQLAKYIATQDAVVTQAIIDKLKTETKLKEVNDQFTQELTGLRIKYEKDTLVSNTAHATRVQQLETRIRGYERLSSSSDVDCRAIADSAARLDRLATEGRQLVEDLRRAVVLRDKQLTNIGETIAYERTVTGK